jgi:hypothetical protein
LALRGQRAVQLDEERFEREAGRDVELLERAPGLPDELGAALGAEGAAAGRVAAQLVEAVVVENGGFRPGRDDDEIAVPRRELLERA